MANEIITTLHPDQDPDTNLYPNVKKDNIPNKSIDMYKLDDDVRSLLSNIGTLRPSGVDTSTNILAFTTNRGIWIGSDTGNWYYYNGTQYVSGGVYQATGDINKVNALTKLSNTGCIIDYSFNGYIDNGGVLVSNASFKASDYIRVDEKIWLTGNFNIVDTSYFIIHCYDDNKVWLGRLLPTGNNNYTNMEVTLVPNTKYIRVWNLATNVNNAENYIIQKPLYLSDINDGYFLIPNISSYSGGYIDNQGNFIELSYFRTSDYIPSTDKIKVSGSLNGGLSSPYKFINCYDVNKNYIGGVITGGSTHNYTDEEIELLPNTCYIRYTNVGSYYKNFIIYTKLINSNDIAILVKDYYDKLVKEEMNIIKGFTAFDRFMVIGDSLSIGYYTDSDNIAHDYDPDHSWGAYIEKLTGSKMYNSSFSGARCDSWLTYNSPDHPTYGLQYAIECGEMPLYVICMGANEGSLPIGTIDDIDDETPTTLYGYVGKVIRELRSISPKCYIVCTGVARPHSGNTIDSVYENVCNAIDKCYYLDCYTEFNSTPFTQYYYNYHFSANGYCAMANLFNNKLSDVMIDNITDFRYINEAE